MEEVTMLKHFVGLDFLQDVTEQYIIIKSVTQ